MTDLHNSYANARDKSIDLDVTPVTGTIGAIVNGVQLSGDLPAATVQAIQAALVRHKVLFFRDQQHLTDQDHEDFAGLLGDPVAHPTVPVAEGSRYLLELDSKEGYAASSWHTDVTFVDAYPKASILRALTIPEAGGDTQWANGETAYEGLPEVLRQLVNNLWATHTNLYDYASILQSAPDGESAAKRIKEHRNVFASTVYETEHPVVRVHPVSGQRSLLLGHFVKQFVGLNAADSARLFQTLQDHITKPENVVRWRWREGDVAIWDNQATQHRATADFGLQRRTLRRATISGEVPVGIDGRRSRTVRKEKAVQYEPA
ncbi:MULTISPECIES: TauD/TfdA family dioxygenase [unclassified Sphingopyxis]|jgi:taurine dioxygenase|uniref:TauD/TfdA dioxygenase family protein n=1 Tax=unclassified Sphingopyxis TaxID=2614943 RepID=UPI0006C08C3C|nr:MULTISPECIES: TauD/TfdA family dioxygenase [unclassified Sphingopyxis]USI77355.1 TauD/TfdA family dioxygenase [Sphingopyxis sp. USTB-05]GAO80165.1 alpha-ketoglutarate-dependent taurine dioxygenase [Sphingopyxis sp. C-1]